MCHILLALSHLHLKAAKKEKTKHRHTSIDTIVHWEQLSGVQVEHLIATPCLLK